MALKGLYRWLWSKIGGRPWTFISRDVWHQLEYLPILLLLFAGWFLGRFWDNALAWAATHPYGALGALFGVSTVWYILGHFFWGKEYKPNQQGDT